MVQYIPSVPESDTGKHCVNGYVESKEHRAESIDEINPRILTTQRKYILHEGGEV